jgi:hypothetical protein
MHREIKTHTVNGLNESLRLYAADERGSGNANHIYDIDIVEDGKLIKQHQYRVPERPDQRSRRQWDQQRSPARDRD